MDIYLVSTFLVVSHLVLSCEGLQCAGHESLRKKKHGQRETRGLTLLQPPAHEIHPEQHVLVPRGQALQAREAHAVPERGDLIVHEAGVHTVEVLKWGTGENKMDAHLSLASRCVVPFVFREVKF